MYGKSPHAAADGYESPVGSLLKLRCSGRPPLAVRRTVTRTRSHFSGILPEQMGEAIEARFLPSSALFGVVQ